MAGLGTVNAAVGGLGDAGRDAATAAAAVGWVPTTTSAELQKSRAEAGLALYELEPPARLVLVGGREICKVLEMYEDERRVFVLVLVQPC